MSELEFLKWGFMAAMGGFMWLVKRNVNTAEESIQRLQVELQLVKEKYLHKDDFKDFKQELRVMFEDLRSDIKSITKHG